MLVLPRPTSSAGPARFSVRMADGHSQTHTADSRNTDFPGLDCVRCGRLRHAPWLLVKTPRLCGRRQRVWEYRTAKPLDLRGQVWVKTRNAQTEQMFSDLLPIADISDQLCDQSAVRDGDGRIARPCLRALLLPFGFRHRVSRRVRARPSAFFPGPAAKADREGSRCQEAAAAGGYPTVSSPASKRTRR
jgi:hypothetical protein